MTTICDTGPLVSYLNRHDRYHAWAVEVMRQVRAPMLTCEAVLTETAYFLREGDVDIEPLFSMIEKESLTIEFDIASHWPRMRVLMARYDRMDLADASIVVMSEQYSRCQVLTIDRNDFSTYRRHDRKTIPFIAPPGA